ncbi:hypothetical protein [Flavisolibacter ginsenosidimutans]|uniref:Uncharacterized protein n=1 Tax=Flavisolibacter ginsenosidimutans TaxID=661481 RepID=A0A5B8ULB3_9BACT|nr:hypothetical protein [Flavisolibacter ginsenosidimutans]QEC57348.1 hypothetical protein FSB75_16050 [Flavisolibacter ginsenosidimutans]
MQTLTKTNAWLLGLGLLFIAAACHNFYKATAGRTGPYASGTIDSLESRNRYFVLRTNSQAFYMKNMALSADRQSLSCTLDTLPPAHKLHLVNGRGGNMRYKKNELDDLQVLNEVHLYATGVSNAAIGENFSLPLDKVQKIEVIEKDQKRTTNSYVIGAVGYTVGAFAVAVAIIAATKSSCPFVSAYDGSRFVMQGEIYGGAIYPQLARHDYLPLKMAPLADGSLQVKITNELKEKQYTDLADLWVITHDANTKVLSDEKGNLYSIAPPNEPLAATLNGRKNLLPALQKEGDNAIAYMDDTTTADASNNLVLRFKKEAVAQKAKLVLTLKNGYWLDLLYGELAKGFGNYYEKYLKKQSKKSKEVLQKWIEEQQLPLTVSLRTKEGWKKISDITTTGPLADRTLVVPIDLRGSNEDSVDVRLSSGFMFWEIDYAGLDFSKGENFSVEKLSPLTATDETGRNVLPLLQNEDGTYLEQPQIGNSTTLSYKSSPLAGASKTQTFILHTKGWYRHVRNFTNGPNVAFLKRFLKPNAFPIYGKELYKQLQAESLPLMAVK